jgi:hypothetical protein
VIGASMRAACLAVAVALAVGSPPAAAQVVNCAGVEKIFASRLSLVGGAMDEDGAFALLRIAAKEDLSICPDLETQRYFVARMAELYCAGAPGSDDGQARALAEETEHRYPRSPRIVVMVARLDGSLGAARRAMSLDPSFEPSRVALAAALVEKDNAPAALATLAEPPSLKSASALLARARIKLAAGDANGALADAIAAADAGSQEAEPTPGRVISRDVEEVQGLSLRALGRSAEAARHLAQAAALRSAMAGKPAMCGEGD